MESGIIAVGIHLIAESQLTFVHRVHELSRCHMTTIYLGTNHFDFGKWCDLLSALPVFSFIF